MYITRNPEDFVTPLPVIATKEYFQAVGAIDYGYMIDQGMVLPFYIKKKLFFRIMVFTTGHSRSGKREKISKHCSQTYPGKTKCRFHKSAACHSFIQHQA